MSDALYNDLTKIIFERYPRIKGAYCASIAYGIMQYLDHQGSASPATAPGDDLPSIDTPSFRALLRTLLQSSTPDEVAHVLVGHIDRHTRAAVSAAAKPTPENCAATWEAFISKRTDYPSPRDRGFFEAGYAATKPTVDLSAQLEEIAQSWDGCRYDDAMIDDIGEALRRDFAKLSLLATKPAAQAVPEGFVLMPKRLTRAMQDALTEEGWQWPDFLAAAAVITEDEYNQLIGNDTLAAAPLSADAAQEQARNDALEEAAKLCDKSSVQPALAKMIRALRTPGAEGAA